MAVALIVAAGSGERLGADRPKALVQVAGRTLLDWSVAALAACDALERIVVALPAGADAPAGVTAVTGGPSRSHSVRAALAAAGDGDPVLVHDAARPLVTAELAAAVLARLASDAGAAGAIAAAPVTDTIKRADEHGAVSETLSRGGLWAVQTPQVFRRAALARALAADDATLAAATDDAQLIEREGGRILICAWEQPNPKVTTPADLIAAAAALAARR
ncbi:MAG TPA: 2-C-methyl-D-erythritol 4-phosphate cytidylyltransferase [Solirubrobacteraceae bacterium]|nr:2-C-methyl-D-erythritol 4-phosphate cytidylyltransferase [Solirubrobacteraceae bacterium]